MEIWKKIDGYSDYEVSTFGNVCSLKFGKRRILTPRKNSDGYFCIITCMNGSEISHRIHRLVAGAFIANDNNYPQVDHIDRDITNNKVENLRWVSQSQNSLNTHRHYREMYGIYWKKQYGFYQVVVTHEGKLKSLGCAPCLEKAKEIRDMFVSRK